MEKQLRRSLTKQDRKRRHSKIVLTDRGVVNSKHRKEDDDESPKITNLSMLFLTEVAKQLSLIDMYNFWASFKQAKKAVDHLWISQRSLSLSPQVLKHFYPDCIELSSPYFHWFNVVYEIIELCGFLPHNRLRALDFEGCCSLDWSLFNDCLEENSVSVLGLFSNIEVISFKNCIVSSDDFVEMAKTMTHIRRITLTESLFHIYPEEVLTIQSVEVENGFKLKKGNTLNKNREKTLNFLATLFPELESVTLLP
ncbi:unnamed protein product [Auanema sp. JU1783]|nr:unnamed protein product [Auanema sp. JU1783]